MRSNEDDSILAVRNLVVFESKIFSDFLYFYYHLDTLFLGSNLLQH